MRICVSFKMRLHICYKYVSLAVVQIIFVTLCHSPHLRQRVRNSVKVYSKTA